MPTRRPAVLTSVLIVCLVLRFSAAAQPSARRVPVFAGNGMVHLLVEIDGSVKTWGTPGTMDWNPGLGDGTRPGPEVKSPRALPSVRDIVDASVGATQVLLLKTDGTVLAWGDNEECEVTGMDTKAKYAPVPVAGLRNVRQVLAGFRVSYAVLEDGTVWRWGAGEGGTCPAPPARMAGLSDITQIVFDGSALALKRDGTVWGWGDNSSGELCDAPKQKHPQPIQVAGASGITAIAVAEQPIFLLADGTLRSCPGRKMPPLSGVKMVKAKGATIFVQLADGTLRGWGLGWYGALGDGHGDQESAVPKAPIGLGPVKAFYMETNGSGTFAVRADGSVWWWGVEAPPGRKTQFILLPEPVPFSVNSTTPNSQFPIPK